MVYSLAWLLIPLNCTLLGKLKSFLISGITVSICSPVIAVRRTRSGTENFPSPVPTKKLSVTRDRQRYLPFTKASIPAAGTLCKIRDVHWDAVNRPPRRTVMYSPLCLFHIIKVESIEIALENTIIFNVNFP